MEDVLASVLEENRGIDVSIIMPCLNEIETLPDCILQAQETVELIRQQLHLEAEVIVSDNGSTDGSIEIAEEMGARVVHVPERGYGYALRFGIESAYGQYIVMADSDGSYDFHESIPMIVKLTEGYDLCMGSRFKGQIMPGAMPWKNRYIGNPLLSGVLNLLFHSGLSDAHSGIRALTRYGYEQLRLTSTGMEFASEMVIKATLVNLSRTEVPVTLRPDGRSRPPHLRPWRDGWRHLRYILMLSPTWLFAIPAAVSGIVGLIIFVLLLLNPNQETVHLGSLTFGNHWMVLASVLLVSSVQNALFAMATTIYGVKAGYRHAGVTFTSMMKRVNLEIMLLIGITLLLSGVFILASVFIAWSTQGYGSLNRIRDILAGATLILIGNQSFFGGFLIAIIAGNVANVHSEISKPMKAPYTAPKPVAKTTPFVSEIKARSNH